jgi:hypothetical protein
MMIKGMKIPMAAFPPVDRPPPPLTSGAAMIMLFSSLTVVDFGSTDVCRLDVGFSSSNVMVVDVLLVNVLLSLLGGSDEVELVDNVVGIVEEGEGVFLVLLDVEVVATTSTATAFAVVAFVVCVFGLSSTSFTIALVLCCAGAFCTGTF